ncbi:MAG: CaiB/BaiF CoA-transferase family protein [Aggregatilineales bacterium]
MTPPLEGVRILDLTRLLPGAICTLLLADLGADVIKIEAPGGGDYARHMPPLIDGEGAVFRATNRGKRSAVIDLKDERGQALLARLATRADVLVESYRPGVMARLNCGYESLRAHNPRLIYVSLSGWGQTGPYAAHAGHDLNYLAVSGMLGAMAMPQPLGGQAADVAGAYAAAAAIAAALLRARSTGEGAFIDLSLYEAGLLLGTVALVEAAAARAGNQHALPFGRGALSGRQACYNVYHAADGRAVALAALEPKFWANFCYAVDRPDLIEGYLDPEHQPDLIAELRRLFASRSSSEWAALLIPAECCFTLVNTPDDALDDPQAKARGLVQWAEDGSLHLSSPLHLDKTPAVAATSPAPRFGADTRDVLTEAGLGQDEIDALVELGVIGMGESD